MAQKKLRVTLLKSRFGRKPGHKECLMGLGLKRIHQCVEIEDNACNRGMINKVAYMVKVEGA